MIKAYGALLPCYLWVAEPLSLCCGGFLDRKLSSVSSLLPTLVDYHSASVGH